MPLAARGVIVNLPARTAARVRSMPLHQSAIVAKWRPRSWPLMAIKTQKNEMKAK